LSEKPDIDNNGTDKNFAILAVDGAYHHFLDGFVSLLFYQIITTPDHDRSKVKFKTRRETVADLRIPINSLKKFMKELEEGLEYYPIHGLVNDNINYVVGSNMKEESNDELNKTLDISDNEVEMNLLRSIAEAQSKLSPEGRARFEALYKQLIRVHIDEFREIIHQDEEKRKEITQNEE